MKALTLWTRGFPAMLGLMCAGCQPPDGQMQARLADAEARAKQAEAAVTELKRKLAEAPSAGSGEPADLQDLKKKLAALEEDNQRLQDVAAKAASASGNPLANIDAKAVESAFVSGFLGMKKEWKEALSDYQVKGYEQPEVTVEDVKPFRTSIGIKLEQGGRSFTAQVPVTADFQGNWSFPSAEEVVGYARQAAANPAASAAPLPAASTAPAVARNPATPPPPATPATNPPPRDTGPEPVPFGGKNLIKLPPIKFPGDP
jgi:uncharacterized coiled-coil protein SlyX